MAILQDQTKPSYEQLMAIIAEQQRLLVERRQHRVSFKVSTKGAVSIYGLGRWPITLYSSQWASLEPMLPALTKFFQDHASELSSKEPSQ